MNSATNGSIVTCNNLNNVVTEKSSSCQKTHLDLLDHFGEISLVIAIALSIQEQTSPTMVSTNSVSQTFTSLAKRLISRLREHYAFR